MEDLNKFGYLDWGFYKLWSRANFHSKTEGCPYSVVWSDKHSEYAIVPMSRIPDYCKPIIHFCKNDVIVHSEG